ncbi:hypothetical protein EHO59_05465 [Leptospira semungkisensis]|uniref:Uncharacterized protein n=1 Tax=Leptospira semungkisensis TaxID=2484985 RepID=A0A4R9G923_9LEPT|nr:hypothetical protein [Leptospira semungkisensis]TGK07550.1 hypothetical protein EHO59_05465 [Leptospira semungkisensis]
MNFLKALVYPIFAASMGFGFFANYRLGGASDEFEEINQVPKTVRQNPGIYRSHYAWFTRNFPGGK